MNNVYEYVICTSMLCENRNREKVADIVGDK